MKRLTYSLMALGLIVATTAPLAQDVDRSQPPPPLGEVIIEFPEFQELTLENGLPVIVVEHFGQPVVNINLFVRAGEAADPAEVAGRAGLMADLLTKGTTTRSATEIADLIEGVGGRLNAGSGQDWLSISSSVLVEHAPLAFDLMQDVVMNSTFPEDELEITRRRALSGLQAQLGQPSSIAQRQFLQEIYGQHPYGVSPVPGTVEAVTRDDVEAFRDAFFAPENALLVISGALPLEDAEALAREHFGDWQAVAEPTPAFVELPERDEPQIYLVHRPGAVQSNIRIGHAGGTPGDPDYFALEVLNRVLGAGADSRLFRILREERGWTYGAYSRFTRPRDVGYFMANAEVRTEVTDSVVVEMLNQLRRLQTEPVPAEEFEAAVNFLAGSFPLRIETPGQVASQVAQARLLGLPPEDVTEYRERIRAVTPADVQRVARTHLHPDRLAIIVVGDATQVLDVLEPIAPITLYDVEGQPIGRDDLVVRGADEAFDASGFEEQTVTYDFLVMNNPAGSIRGELRRDGDVWVARSTMDSPMMSQQTEVRFGVRDFAPVSSEMRIQQGPMTIRSDLRVENGRIVGRIDLPEQMGPSRDVDLELVDGMLLPGMDVFLPAAVRLEEGRSITVPVYDVMGGAMASSTYDVGALEGVEVGAGSFEVYRVTVSGPQPMTLFVSRDTPHLVVRQEFTAQPIVLELQAIH